MIEVKSRPHVYVTQIGMKQYGTMSICVSSNMGALLPAFLHEIALIG